jgi:ubiquitin thioesterase protein OTUB1
MATTAASNAIVVFLRLLTSAQIRKSVEDYAPFLFHPDHGEPVEPEYFCQHFVEAVDKEADHVQIMALARALQVNVDVAYLDGHDAGGNVNFVNFENADGLALGGEPLTLLYRYVVSSREMLYNADALTAVTRPGHYDILEKKRV